ASDVQAYPNLVSDGVGGAIITWRDSRNYAVTGVDIYAQRVDSAGNILWTTNGVAVCTATGNQMDPIITSDGASGAIIAWMDSRGTYTNVYMQRLNASGVPQWAANGVGYLFSANSRWLGGRAPIVSDGASGAIIVWEDDYYGPSDFDLRALRITAAGTFAWGTWICGALGNQFFPVLASDGSGGAIIAWQDYRYGDLDPDIYAQRVNASGVVQWVGNGQYICGALTRQEAPEITGDSFGGATITWHDYRNYGTSGVDIYAQRVDEWGAAQWTPHGIPISTASNAQQNPMITRAGTCDAIITWDDQRWVGHPTNDTDWDIYAQRVFCDGALPIQLASFTAREIPGRGVILEWTTVSELNNYGFYVQRRPASQPTFIELTNSFVPGHGTTNEPQHYSYMDSSAVAGTLFYRLRQVDLDGTVHYTDPISIEVVTGVEDLSRPKEYALHQNYPNPFNPSTEIRYQTPEVSHVTRKVFDILGREGATLVDGVEDAGYKSVRFDASNLASGVYFYRMAATGDNGERFLKVEKMMLLK
ncbi:MAG: T9SS type A sorting domain-containing protein, partial [Bacteroidota bacterium]